MYVYDVKDYRKTKTTRYVVLVQYDVLTSCQLSKKTMNKICICSFFTSKVCRRFIAFKNSLESRIPSEAHAEWSTCTCVPSQVGTKAVSVWSVNIHLCYKVHACVYYTYIHSWSFTYILRHTTIYYIWHHPVQERTTLPFPTLLQVLHRSQWVHFLLEKNWLRVEHRLQRLLSVVLVMESHPQGYQGHPNSWTRLIAVKVVLVGFVRVDTGRASCNASLAQSTWSRPTSKRWRT